MQPATPVVDNADAPAALPPPSPSHPHSAAPAAAAASVHDTTPPPSSSGARQPRRRRTKRARGDAAAAGANRFVETDDAAAAAAGAPTISLELPTADTPSMEAWLMALPPALVADSQKGFTEDPDATGPEPYANGEELLEEIKEMLDNDMDTRIFVRQQSLSRDEAMAVLVYTAQCPRLFGDANRNMRLGNREALEPVWPFLQWLLSALPKLPSHDGVVYRVLSSRDATAAHTYTVGRRPSWPAFSSASTALSSEQLSDFGFDDKGDPGVLLVADVGGARSVGPLTVLPPGWQGMVRRTVQRAAFNAPLAARLCRHRANDRAAAAVCAV